jgi:hypothetical protein
MVIYRMVSSLFCGPRSGNGACPGKVLPVFEKNDRFLSIFCHFPADYTGSGATGGQGQVCETTGGGEPGPIGLPWYQYCLIKSVVADPIR